MSGPSLDLDQLIGEIVQTFVQERRCLNEKEGLYLGFGLSYGLFEDDAARTVNGETRYSEKRTYVHFLFTQDRARTNSIRVFFAEGGGEPFEPDDLKKLKWKQSAHHDSVWRTEGLQPLHSVDSSIREALTAGTVAYIPGRIAIYAPSEERQRFPRPCCGCKCKESTRRARGASVRHRRHLA